MGYSVHVPDGHLVRIESDDARLQTLKQALAAFPDPLSGLAPLPIAAEIDARPARFSEARDRIYLQAIRDALMILVPRRFLREPKQIGAGNVVMVPELAATHPAKKSFGIVRVRLRLISKTVGFFAVDPMKREAGR